MRRRKVHRRRKPCERCKRQHTVNSPQERSCRYWLAVERLRAKGLTHVDPDSAACLLGLSESRWIPFCGSGEPGDAFIQVLPRKLHGLVEAAARVMQTRVLAYHEQLAEHLGRLCQAYREGKVGSLSPEEIDELEVLLARATEIALTESTARAET